jgi:hypothetical protein
MYLTSLHGQATSGSPGASGLPTECRAGTNGASSPIAASTALPIRVMIRIEATTYGLSVSSTPNIGFIGFLLGFSAAGWLCASSGPMQNGTTYMVRPRMQPR